MTDEKTIKALINPLQFLEVDEPWAKLIEKKPTLESIVNFLCTPGINSDVDSVISRYKDISKEKERLFAAPYEQRIMDKLVWPLRHAKSGYMIGNYLGTIALCGMVAEMVAILLFEISEFKLNNKPMLEENQIAVFGSKFEKLNQDRRIQILHAYGVIDEKLKSALNIIRTKRRTYLHLWSQDHERLPQDAIETYNAAILIVVFVIGQNVKDGKIILNPSLVNYLAQKGIYEDSE